jgi:hypothetical protein
MIIQQQQQQLPVKVDMIHDESRRLALLPFPPWARHKITTTSTDNTIHLTTILATWDSAASTTTCCLAWATIFTF